MAAAWWPRLNVSLQAVAEVLLVIGCGVWLAARRGLDHEALAAVSSVNWHCLIPALMFSSIVGAITPSSLVSLWPLLLMSLVHVVLGLIPALLLGWAARLPRDLYFFCVMASSLPNCGNLPWLFMPTIIRYFTPPEAVAGAIQYSTGLTSVYTITIVLLTLTVPFMFQRPPATLVLPRSQLDGGGGVLAPPQQQEQELQEQQPEQQLEQQPEQQQQPGQQQQGQEQHSARPGGDAQQGALAAAAKLPGAAGLHAPRAPAQQPWSRDSSFSDQLRGLADRPGLGVQAPAPAAVAVHACAHHSHHVAPHADAHVWPAPFEVLDDAEHDPPPAQHGLGHRPYLGGAQDSLASHRSSSLLLRQLRSFSRSFSRGLNRSLRRSNSLVQLVWSFPAGWQPAHRGADSVPATRHARGACGAACCLPAGPLPPWCARLAAGWRAVLDHPVVNLPLGATLAGVACAAIGPVRSVLVSEMAALHWLWLGLGWVGAAAAPLATLQIGAELMQAAPGAGAASSMHVPRRVQWTANAIAISVKLVVVPLLGTLVLRLGGVASLVPRGDAVYQLLMLVEAAVPAAVTLLVVCGRVYPDIRPLSHMLFWQYVASALTLPAFLMWFMSLLGL